MAGARPFSRWLRWAAAAQLVLLLAQFEFGEWLTIFGEFPAIRMKGFSLDAFAYNVVATGPMLVAHAALGITVFALAVLIFLLSFLVRIRWLRIAAALALASVAAAGLAGFLFVTQGFAGDRSLFLMGTGFISVFVATSFALHLVLTSVSSSGSSAGADALEP